MRITEQTMHIAMKARLAEIMDAHGDLSEEFLAGMAFGMSSVTFDATRSYPDWSGMPQITTDLIQMRDVILAERRGS